jgi:Fe-S-cluster containining protein
MLKDFKCNRCGLCCHSPRLYKEDIKNIIKAGHKEQDFLITDFRGVTYIKEKNGWCTFLKKGKSQSSCKIYKARPKICIQYPTKLIGNSCIPQALVSGIIFEKNNNNKFQ